MDLYQVRYFLTIAETGNFSRAAERLYLSQPSLSTGIKKLEQELGVTLFERGGRRTVLTPAGRSFLDKAAVMMQQYQAAVNEMKGFHSQPTLRVGVLSTMRVAALAHLVSSFQHQHPNVTIELLDSTVEKLREGLDQGAIDVALTVLSLQTSAGSSLRDESQTSQALFRQPLLLAVPKSHPFAQRASIRLIELNGQPFIERVNCEFFQQEYQLLAAAAVQPKVIYRACHEEWVISLIRAELGISIMPYWHGLTDIAYLSVSKLNFQRTIGIKWRVHQRTELVEQFCHFAVSHDWSRFAKALKIDS